MKKVLIGIISVVAVLGFLFLAYKATNTSTSPKTFADVSKLDKSDHLKWSKDKKIILVEYADLQCPACKSFHDFIQTDIEASKSADSNLMKKITYVYRHFPLPQHAHSQEAADAAEAAGKQGKFYEFSDILFDKQKEWAEAGDAVTKFEGYAKSLGLDLEKFKKDSDSKQTKDKVAKDLDSGQKFAVNATPTFYLNGQKIENVSSFADFLKPLQDAK